MGYPHTAQPVCIAIVGAESTGKTTLAKALAGQLHTAQSAALWVGEYLREWCAAHGRTPTAAEQPHIAHTQARRMMQARSAVSHPSTGSERTDGMDHPSTGSGRTGGVDHPSTGSGRTGMVLADGAPLVTAVYSELYFNDDSLYTFALEHHKTYALTLLTGMDVAWVADGLQRDSEAMRQRFDARLRAVLVAHRIPFSTIYGQGQARTYAAQQAIASCLSPAASPQTGTTGPQWQWSCEKCSDAACEHRLFRSLL